MPYGHACDFGANLIKCFEGLDEVKLGYLERLYEHDLTHPGISMEDNQYLMQEADLGLHAASGVVRTLGDMGLVFNTSGLDEPSARILDGGRDVVQRLRAYRADPAVRARIARDAVLACVYKATLNRTTSLDPDSLLGCEHGAFLGGRLTKVEIYRACDHLEERKLITVSLRTASNKPHSIGITPLGEDCMTDSAGDVASFLKDQKASQTVFQTSVTDSNGVIIGTQRDFTQNVNVGVDPAALREIVATLMPELSRFGNAEPEAQAAVEEIAEEALAQQPNKGRLKRAFGKLLQLAGGVGATLLTAYLTHKAQQLGLLPETPAPTGSLPLAP